MFNIHKFNSVEEFNAVYKGDGYSEPWVSHTNGGGVNYNKSEEEKLPITPLTFRILSDGNILWKSSSYSSDSIKTIQYSKNGGEWTNITSTTSGATIPVVEGDIVRFKGNAWPAYLDSTHSKYSYFNSTCRYSVEGNPASLKYGENLTGNDQIYYHCFTELFHNSINLISASKLKLPANDLQADCYYGMFEGCSNLESAPELPATTLAEYCYHSMFRGCTSLTKAPELPATTLTNSCYYYMFYGCSSLIKAPELLSETLATYCYREMFRNCTSLVEIKCLATNISADRATNNWTYGIGSNAGTFYKKSGVTWSSGASGIPSSWTVVEV